MHGQATSHAEIFPWGQHNQGSNYTQTQPCCCICGRQPCCGHAVKAGLGQPRAVQRERHTGNGHMCRHSPVSSRDRAHLEDRCCTGAAQDPCKTA